MTTLLITATDTDAGKTIITTALRAYYHYYFPQMSTGLMKLLQTGEIGDAEFYRQFFDDVVIPQRFSAPLAPPIAADLEGKTIDIDLIWRNYQQLAQTKDIVLLETLGGLGSPVTHELTVADIASSWGLETILIVPVKLGAVAHTVANVALARHHKIKLKGIIFNCVTPCSQTDIENWTPQKLIESLTQTPVLGYFPYQENLTDLKHLAQQVADYLVVDEK
ncbi:MAG: ATP-dependent dethiobiotin synthetase BioD [Cyanobacterium sp. T60_A2020_053]|nr:ATP-dependent dethiobiotin synthetase BioD [Cyanobacterium sp. T60_A2020_053]